MLVVVCLVSTGCVRYTPQPLAPAQTASTFDQRRLTAPDLRAFIETRLHRRLPQWPPAQWDFDLLTWAAFYYHPSLEVARARWAVARAAEITAGQRPNPTLAAAPGYTLNAERGMNPWLAFVDLDWPIETAGKRARRLDRARLVSESARLRIVATAWDVRRTLRDALLSYQDAVRRRTLLQQQLEVLKEIVARLEQKRAAGAVSEAEVIPWRAARNRTRLELATLEQQRRSARARIAAALGVPLSALDEITFADTFPTPSEAVDRLTSATARDVALRRRADIRSALADYAAAEATLRLEIAKQYPDIHLGTGYEFDQGDHKWSLGPSLELPILHHNQGPIAEAQARRAETAARFLALQARVIAQIDQAVEAWRASQRRLQAALDLVATLEQQQRQIEQARNVGAVESLDVLRVRSDVVQARLALEVARLERHRALGRLEDTLQQPLDLIPPALLERKPAAWSGQHARKEPNS